MDEELKWEWNLFGKKEKWKGTKRTNEWIHC